MRQNIKDKYDRLVLKSSIRACKPFLSIYKGPQIQKPNLICKSHFARMFQRLEGNNELLVSSPARQQTSEMPPDYLRQIFQIILRKRCTFKAKSYCNIAQWKNIMSLRLGCQGQMFPKCWPMPGFFGGFVHNAMRALQSDHLLPKKVCPYSTE